MQLFHYTLDHVAPGSELAGKAWTGSCSTCTAIWVGTQYFSANIRNRVKRNVIYPAVSLYFLFLKIIIKRNTSDVNSYLKNKHAKYCTRASSFIRQSK